MGNLREPRGLEQPWGPGRRLAGAPRVPWMGQLARYAGRTCLAELTLSRGDANLPCCPRAREREKKNAAAAALFSLLVSWPLVWALVATRPTRMER